MYKHDHQGLLLILILQELDYCHISQKPSGLISGLNKPSGLITNPETQASVILAIKGDIRFSS